MNIIPLKTAAIIFIISTIFLFFGGKSYSGGDIESITVVNAPVPLNNDIIITGYFDDVLSISTFTWFDLKLRLGLGLHLRFYWDVEVRQERAYQLDKSINEYRYNVIIFPNDDDTVNIYKYIDEDDNYEAVRSVTDMTDYIRYLGNINQQPGVLLSHNVPSSDKAEDFFVKARICYEGPFFDSCSNYYNGNKHNGTFHFRNPITTTTSTTTTTTSTTTTTRATTTTSRTTTTRATTTTTRTTTTSTSTTRRANTTSTTTTLKTWYNVHAVVATYSDEIISGATVSANNGGGSSVTNSYWGTADFTVPMGWSGRITISKPGYVFWPEYEDYTNLDRNLHLGFRGRRGSPFTTTPTTTTTTTPAFYNTIISITTTTMPRATTTTFQNTEPSNGDGGGGGGCFINTLVED